MIDIVKINVLKKKLAPVLKKATRIIPKTVRLIPPSNSFFHARMMSPINPTHGNVFGLFFIKPIIPPPKDSDPDKSAKVKTNSAIINKE